MIYIASGFRKKDLLNKRGLCVRGIQVGDMRGFPKPRISFQKRGFLYMKPKAKDREYGRGPGIED